MNMQELSRYYKLKERLIQNQEILRSLQAKASVGISVLTGLPHTSGTSDKVSYLGIEIAYMKEQIEVLKGEITTEKQKLEAYIDGIDDDRVKIICRLRYVHCMTWIQVADTMGWAYNDTSVRKLVSNYLKKHNQDV